MAMKQTLHLLLSIGLSLSLLLLFFGWCNLFDFNVSHQVSISQHHTFRSNRKVLATKFDFSPFLQKHPRQHRQRHGYVPITGPEPSVNEIDPRYGVEKRLVPTGPNPLHH
ncbi:hypothetical protein HRI_003199400 [Hibiscus trionum]|uniref:Uncharacterized protein n=1 Tax=Hibiscus trionum TaxID=183268 RepID=A0A9W7MC63_HIBTR|nr:hypothetical protein HRI_003199400 [Hibiscus trionum]